MKFTRLTLCAIGSIILIGCAAKPSKSASWRSLGEPSDAIRQAWLLTGFDYRSNLQLAIHKDSGGLHALFQFTDSEPFVGAGAEDHCSMLMHLLYIWGDRPFAKELATENQKIREAVVHALDYAGYPEWSSKNFSSTYAVAEHVKMQHEPYSP